MRAWNQWLSPILPFESATGTDFLLQKEMWKSNCQPLSPVWLSATPWTAARQAPLSVGLCRQEDCSGLPFPSPGESCWPRDQTWVPALQADSLPSEPPRVVQYNRCIILFTQIIHKKQQHHQQYRDFSSGQAAKNLPCNASDTDSTPGCGRSHMPQGN